MIIVKFHHPAPIPDEENGVHSGRQLGWTPDTLRAFGAQVLAAVSSFLSSKENPVDPEVITWLPIPHPRGSIVRQSHWFEINLDDISLADRRTCRKKLSAFRRELEKLLRATVTSWFPKKNDQKQEALKSLPTAENPLVSLLFHPAGVMRV